MSDLIAAVNRLAAGQWGLLTAAQARQHNISATQLNRLVGAGVLERVQHGVYASAAAPDLLRELRAAWLALAPEMTAEERLRDPAATGVVSHTSAASLHELGDLLSDVPEVTVAHRKQTRLAMRIHRGTLNPDDITIVDGLPTTTPERTVADLLRDGHETSHVAQALADALSRDSIELDRLALELAPLAHRLQVSDGPAAVDRLLEAAELDTASVLRTPVAQSLLAAGARGAVIELLLSPTGDGGALYNEAVATMKATMASLDDKDPLRLTTQNLLDRMGADSLIAALLAETRDRQAEPLRHMTAATSNPSTAPLREEIIPIDEHLRAPLLSLIRSIYQVPAQDAIRLAASPQARGLQRWWDSPAGRHTRRASEDTAEHMERER